MRKQKTNNRKQVNVASHRINDEITVYGNVRIVMDGEDSEVCHIDKAREKAERLGLDLIEISRNANPPVLRIADYQKMVYELKKNAKKQMHSSKPVKEIQLSVSIAPNDMETKAKNARRFLEDGSKVKVVLSMKGREKVRREENKKSLYEFITMLDDIARPESMPKDEGESKTIVILRRK